MLFEIHLHSNYSDGWNSVEEIAKHVKKIGLDGFALTDHNTTAGLKKAQEVAKKEKLVFIPGLEINCAEGHINVFGKNVPHIKQWKDMPIVEALENTHKQACIAVAVHPYDILRFPMFGLAKKLCFDYIEVWNARTFFPFLNTFAENAADEIKAKKAAGSDAHCLEEIGYGTIEAAGAEGFYNGKARVFRREWLGPKLIIKEKIRRTFQCLQ